MPINQFQPNLQRYFEPMVQNSQVLAALFKAGCQVYAVGGAVRDIALGVAPSDLDFVVRGLEVDELITLLHPFGQADLLGKRFGVIKFWPVLDAEKQALGGYPEIDFALPRKEVSLGAGHKDFQIEVSAKLSIEEDLRRRDFTINAMAYELASRQLIDPLDGASDLTRQTVRMCFTNTFKEDPLRILRAYKYITRFGFVWDSATYQELSRSREDLAFLSHERIWEELRQIFESSKNIQATSEILWTAHFLHPFLFTSQVQAPWKGCEPELVPILNIWQGLQEQYQKEFAQLIQPEWRLIGMILRLLQVGLLQTTVSELSASTPVSARFYLSSFAQHWANPDFCYPLKIRRQMDWWITQYTRYTLGQALYNPAPIWHLLKQFDPQISAAPFSLLQNIQGHFWCVHAIQHFAIPAPVVEVLVQIILPHFNFQPLQQPIWPEGQLMISWVTPTNSQKPLLSLWLELCQFYSMWYCQHSRKPWTAVQFQQQAQALWGWLVQSPHLVK